MKAGNFLKKWAIVRDKLFYIFWWKCFDRSEYGLLWKRHIDDPSSQRCNKTFDNTSTVNEAYNTSNFIWIYQVI